MGTKTIILKLDLTECGSNRKNKEIEMASGRHSGDPTDLLLVDPSQPEATKRTRKHLTKRQKEIFVQYGFSKALLREVIAAGWDQVDINNYVLYYNSQVETSLAMPAPGLDISMKKAINTVIRTKLQEQEQGTRARRARDWFGNPSQPEGTIHRRTP